MKALPLAQAPISPAERQWSRIADREIIHPDPGHSVRWAEHDFPAEIARWNYHPEYELHLIRKSEGRFIIGDKVGVFAPGHVSLVGPGIPHDWVSFVEPGEIVKNRDALIQFDDEWLQQCTRLLPELEALGPILQHSRRGIVFHGDTALTIAAAIEDMGLGAGIRRLSFLIQIFSAIATAPSSDIEYFDADFVRREAGPKSNETADIGLEYIFKNLHTVVRLSEAARLANMSESAFSMYFRRASGATFTEMTRRLRMTHARKLLETTDDAIADICQAVGYQNLSNFNRQFLASTGSTPSEFRRIARSRLRADRADKGGAGPA